MKLLMMICVLSTLGFAKEIGLKFGYVNTISNWDVNERLKYDFNPYGESTHNYGFGGDVLFNIALKEYLAIEVGYQGSAHSQSFDAQSSYFSTSKDPDKSYSISSNQSFLMSRYSFALMPQIEFENNKIALGLGAAFINTTKLENEFEVDEYEISFNEFLKSIEINSGSENALKSNKTFSIFMKLDYSYKVIDAISVGTYVGYDYFYEPAFKNKDSEGPTLELTPDYYSMGVYFQINFGDEAKKEKKSSGVVRKAIK